MDFVTPSALASGPQEPEPPCVSGTTLWTRVSQTEHWGFTVGRSSTHGQEVMREEQPALPQVMLGKLLLSGMLRGGLCVLFSVRSAVKWKACLDLSPLGSPVMSCKVTPGSPLLHVGYLSLPICLVTH